jgi:hypothetical protein
LTANDTSHEAPGVPTSTEKEENALSIDLSNKENHQMMEKNATEEAATPYTLAEESKE